MIPRILHQMYRDADSIPVEFRPLMSSWRRLLPHWRFNLWTDAAIERMIALNYPTVLPLYETLPHDIQRFDLARYLILHHCGGVYADLDYELLGDLEPWLARDYLLAELHPGQIGNALMGSATGWAIWLDFIDSIPEAIEQSNAHGHNRFHKVLYTTGPGHLDRYMKQAGMRWEPWQMFAPIPDRCLHLLAPGPTPNGAVAKHWWNAGWVQGDGISTVRDHMRRTHE